MRTRDPKIDLLRHLWLLSSAGRRELRAVAAAADLATVPAGHVLVRAGGRATEVYVIVAGTAEVVLDGRVLVAVGPGEFVGEVGVIDGQPRTADVVATSEVTVLAVHASQLRALLAASPGLRRGLLQQLAHRVRRMDLAPAA